MASTDSALGTGAGHDKAEMRRRNVSSYEKANGNTVYSLEAEDTKKLQKKVRTSGLGPKNSSVLIPPHNSSRKVSSRS